MSMLLRIDIRKGVDGEEEKWGSRSRSLVCGR